MKQTMEYRPGYYGKKRLRATEWADAYIKKWHSEQKKEMQEKEVVCPSICLSRQIGVGALEIADLLSQLIDYRVIDREILEYMAEDTNLTEKAIEFYDERYPGKMSELFSMLINEKTFLKSDYARQLAKTVTALANTEPTIFVGRGTHLILPRDQILSVQLICSQEYRVDRIAGIMGLDKEAARTKLNMMDIEQHEFFKTVYGKKQTTPDEFDLIINRDHLKSPFQAAKIVVCAFEQKFGLDSQ